MKTIYYQFLQYGFEVSHMMPAYVFMYNYVVAMIGILYFKELIVDI